ncbi:unnamed protein product [Allacma fusca]|uniref:Protein TAPT1 homolog n=1 Tax=Allacma fusca TaxID=39272 RepID=A0A8J2LXX1_9HEXA|nr:unnamed protein product [Allacma fusca]
MSGTQQSSDAQGSPSKKSSFVWKRSLKDYVTQELTRGYILELEEERYAARREKVYTFFCIPRELEKLMAYGFFQCSDAFLFVFTFLPLRCLLGILRVALKILQNIVNFEFPLRRLRGFLKPAEKCDLIKLFIFVACAYIYSYIDTSVLYHVIKSQSVIKLYIFFNMLEVGDRLFSSFVQDTLDALFLTATEKSDKKSQMGVTAHLLLALFSVFGHAMVILLQATTLSVAINANNRALLTVMMSNNFVELKGAVFKKFDKINLFQVSCSDVRERFHLCILLLLVCVQTMREYSWEESRFWVLFPDCVMVLLAEICIDWLKHAFITRFNEIPAEVYREYTLSLAYDLAQTKQRRAFSDHSDMVGRRLGFVPLPLAVVLARILRPSLKGPIVATAVLATLAYIALSSFRLLGSIILLGKACDLIDQHKKESPQHTTSQVQVPQAQTDSKITAVSSTLSDDLHLKFKPASQPTTRTPSPSRIGGSFSQPLKDSNKIFNDENSPFGANFDFVPPKTAYSPRLSKRSYYTSANNGKMKGEKKHYYRSFSASHTPRPSIGSGLSSLGEVPVPGLPDASTALLMANSSVSILSMNLNEEMLRAAVSNIAQTQPDMKQEQLSATSSMHSLPGDVQLSSNENPVASLKVKRNFFRYNHDETSNHRHGSKSFLFIKHYIIRHGEWKSNFLSHLALDLNIHIKTLSEILLKGVQLPHLCAKKMLDGAPLSLG